MTSYIYRTLYDLSNSRSLLRHHLGQHLPLLGHILRPAIPVNRNCIDWMTLKRYICDIKTCLFLYGFLVGIRISLVLPSLPPPSSLSSLSPHHPILLSLPYFFSRIFLLTFLFDLTPFYGHFMLDRLLCHIFLKYFLLCSYFFFNPTSFSILFTLHFALD
jgi:hypothetical protein